MAFGSLSRGWDRILVRGLGPSDPKVVVYVSPLKIDTFLHVECSVCISASRTCRPFFGQKGLGDCLDHNNYNGSNSDNDDGNLTVLLL